MTKEKFALKETGDGKKKNREKYINQNYFFHIPLLA